MFGYLVADVEEPGSDDKVSLAGKHGLEEIGDLGWVVLAISVKHDDGKGVVLPGTVEAFHEGLGLALVGRAPDDLGAGKGCDLGGLVC